MVFNFEIDETTLRKYVDGINECIPLIDDENRNARYELVKLGGRLEEALLAAERFRFNKITVVSG